jgi:ABC-type transport system substrate-binding protein
VPGLPGLALKSGRLKDEYARAGLVLAYSRIPITNMWVINLRNPAVGSMARERIALRRAMFMAFDDAEFARVVQQGAQERQQLVPPGIEGYVTDYRNPNRFNRETANALLDRFGYKRGADGVRRNPDGSALVIPYVMHPDGDSRTLAEFVKRMLDRVGLRIEIEARQDWQKRVLLCAHGMAIMSHSASVPDGAEIMSTFLGKHAGSGNTACVADDEFDATWRKVLLMPPGPAREEVFRAMQTRLDTLGVARPLPTSEIRILKQPYVLGPFGTSTDWLQLMTLGVAER